MARRQLAILVLLLVSNLATSVESFAASSMQPEMRDPTCPPASLSYSVAGKATEEYGLKIDAIIIGKDRKVVVINGQHLQVGDKIMGVKIIDIYPQSIKVKDVAKEMTIEMLGPDIKEKM